MATKLMLNCEEDLWKEVKKYQIDHDKVNLNDTVVELITKGLKR